MGLSLDGAALGTGDRLRQLVCRGTHERHGFQARAAVHDQGGRLYLGRHTDRYRAIVAKDGAPAVGPSLEAVLKGTYQPLARPIFI